MLKKRLFIYILIICLLLSTSNIVVADDKIDVLNIDQVKECASEIIEEDNLKINSRNAIILDRKTGKVLWGKNENKRSAMASTTKIMTCLVVLEKANLNE